MEIPSTTVYATLYFPFFCRFCVNQFLLFSLHAEIKNLICDSFHCALSGNVYASLIIHNTCESERKWASE